MYNRGLLIFNAFTVYKSMSDMIARFKKEFAKFNIAIDWLKNDEVVAYIDENGNAKNNLRGYDFCIYLDKDYYIAKLLEKSGMRVFNRSDAIRVCDDKMLTHVALVNEGIKMPITINYPLRYGDGDDTNFHQRVLSILQFPLIIKECFGSLGEQVYLIKNEEEYWRISAKLRQKPHIYQEFIASSYGHDLRLALVNKKVVAHMYREATNDDFRSNIETGGIGKQIVVPEAFSKMAEKIATILDLDYCGIDLLYGSNDEPIFCEVNSNAYLGPIELYSKVNVGYEYAKHIYNLVYLGKNA